jgi:hypothetical protein
MVVLKVAGPGAMSIDPTAISTTRFRCSVRGGDVESGGEQPHLLGLALEPSGQLQAGMAALVPRPGQVRGDPDDHTVVVAPPQPGEQLGVRVGGMGVAGGADLVDRRAQGIGDLAGPGLGVGVDGVGVIQVAQHVRQALLHAGQVVVVAGVAALVVADQHPTEDVDDPERVDRGLGAVPGGAVPDQVRTAAGVGAHRAHGVDCGLARSGSRAAAVGDRPLTRDRPARAGAAAVSAPHLTTCVARVGQDHCHRP